MKKKNSFRALLLSSLALLLSVSMLVGSTFAWFTDSVVSANNIIKSGNLDVELYYMTEGMSDWEKVTDQTNVFKQNTLWEPGHTEVVNLKIVNEGSLALKYQLGVNVVSETGSVSVLGNDFLLSDFIQFGIVSDKTITNRADAIAAVKDSAQPLKTAYASESISLMPKADGAEPSTYEKVVTMVVYMPTEVDNRANYAKGEAQPVINLGINLFATQFTAEQDSFDHLYDESAAVFTVEDANKLLEQGKDVNLVNCNEPDGILYVPANYSGVLVLNNVKIASVQESAVAGAALDSEVMASAKAGQIVILGNVVVKATADGMSAITGTKLDIIGNGTLTAIAQGDRAYGIGGPATQSISIKGITIKEVVGGRAGEIGTDTKYYKDAPEGGAAIGSGLDGAVINLENVTVKKAVGGSKTAAIGANYHTGVTVNITGSTINAEGGATAAAIGSSRVSSEQEESGTTINIVGSTITAKGGVYGAGIGSGYDTHCKAGQPLCTINITDSIINATGGQYAAGVGTGYHNAALAGEIKNSTINAASGEKFYKNSYTAAMDIGFGVVDMAREGKDSTSAIVVNGKTVNLKSAPAAADASNLTDAVKAGGEVVLKSGTYTFPTSSINADTTLICEPGTVFEGESDLNVKGATVVGATFSNPSGVVVDQTINGVFKDCTFKGSNALRWCYAGETVVFENCVFDGKTYGVHFDGGANEVVFKNCTFSGFNTMGGEVKLLTMENCTFKALGNSNYNGINLWGNTNMTNCTFVFDGSVGNEWCDARGKAGAASYNINFNNCVVIDANGTSQSIEDWGKVGNENNIAVISYK